jgi:16S rRNA (uracil1498-N3)-methyltransferase
MKQSLRSFQPELIFINRLKDIADSDGKKIIFEQNSLTLFNRNIINNQDNYFLIFGPEGGLDSSELSSITTPEYYRISPNRLRTETAIIKAASLITVF